MSLASGVPRVSVILPSFDHAEFVVGAVQSVLDQTMPDFELIVIDDGSRDDSLERLVTIRDPRMTVQSHPNRGLSATLNRGLALARAPWVKFLPSDDMLAPDCLRRQLAAAESLCDEPTARPRSLVFCLPEIVDRDGFPLLDDPALQAWFDVAQRNRAEILPALVERNFLSAPGALFPGWMARLVGGFDPSMRIAQDYDLWLRLLPHCRARLLDERLVRVRWHGANQSAVVTPSSEAERARALCRALETLPLDAWFPDVTLDSPSAAARALELARLVVAAGLGSALPFARGLAQLARAGGEVHLPADLAALVDDGGPVQRVGLTPMGARLAGVSSTGDATSSEHPVRVQQGGPDVAGPRFARLRRMARRLGVVGSPPAPAPVGVTSSDATLATFGGASPRPLVWLLLGGGPGSDPRRLTHLADALRGGGAHVAWSTLVDPVDAAGTATGERIPFTLAALRRWLGDARGRVRVLIDCPHPIAVAIGREAGAVGCRVLYDKTQKTLEWRRVAQIHPDDERALLEVADEVVTPRRELLREAAAPRRPVHLVPDPSPASADGPDRGDRAGWAERAGALTALVADPTLRVVIPGGGAVGQTADAVASVLRIARGRRWQVTVVERGMPAADLAEMEKLEEAGEIQLVRDARGRAGSALALGLRASRSEMLLWLQPELRLRGFDALDSGLALLTEHSRIGGVVAASEQTDPTPPREIRAAGPGAWLLPRAVLHPLGVALEECVTPADVARAIERALGERGESLVVDSDLGVGPEPAGP